MPTLVRAAARQRQTTSSGSRREADSAKEAGIDGVPCFIFGGLVAVSGAQSPEHLAQAIERAADEYAKRVAAE